MIDTMQHPMTPIIAAKFAILKPLLDEQARRLWAAVEARALGRGGISQVAEATGLSRATVRAGLQELALPATPTAPQTPPERLRRPGGGRKPLGTRDPHLLQALETLVDPVTRGDPGWHRQGQPEEVNVYDFPDKVLGKIIPYGVYDEATNAGWVSVGVDHDTAAFAVETVRRWWRHMGSQVYPKAKRILITADGGGSKGSTCRLWKVELQRLANESGLGISR